MHSAGNRVGLNITPAEAIAQANEYDALSFRPLVGGIDPDVAWESLQLFADRVLPELTLAPLA